MSDYSAERDPVEVLAEEFSQRRRRGERPTIDDYAAAHPHLAGRIRRLFPVLVVMDDVAETADSQPPESASQTTPVVPPESQRPVLSPERGSRQDEDYRKIVHRRFLILSAVASFVFALFFLILLGEFSPVLNREQFGWVGFGLIGTTALFWVYFLVRCVANPHLSLAELRNLDGVAVVLVGLTIAYSEWMIFIHAPEGDFEGPRHAQSYVAMVNFGRCFEWFILIVIYGLFIPNPWWRTALVALGYFVLALLVVPLAALSSTLIRDHSLYLLTWTVTSLLAACAISIFGAFKISTLQQEVFVARKLGPYHLKQRLGSGGMGEVYLAEHRLLKRLCAVKIIRPERAGERQLLSRFEREVQVTAQLTHPNTVEIFDYGHSDDGTFYYVMEYLEGKNLDELVDQYGPLPSGRVIHLVRQLCGALREAHANGLVHRDIKPSNVIVCRQGGLHDVVKLLDFGLVGTMRANPEATRLTEEGITMGTPQYMSPEQAKGMEAIDARSDLYSLGGLMYFLLAGRPPFVANSKLGVVLAHIGQPVPPLRDYCPDVPADVDAVVMRCLSKEPSERFADAQSLDAALRNCDCAESWCESVATTWWARVEVPGM
jgi:tRNA A-37 threonylcarbamoyl transferase component Bud32